MENDTLVAVDIAKEVFELGVSDRPAVVRRRRWLTVSASGKAAFGMT